MSLEKFESLVRDMCKELEVNADEVIKRSMLEVSGHQMLVQHYGSDPEALYLNFNFGILTEGRTLAGFQLLLQSNITIYGQDQAQLGLNPSTGAVLLIVRVPMTDDVNGSYLVDTFTHYSQHGNYWRENLMTLFDEQHQVPPPMHFVWMRA